MISRTQRIGRARYERRSQWSFWLWYCTRSLETAREFCVWRRAIALWLYMTGSMVLYKHILKILLVGMTQSIVWK